jgi:tetratricopeptide (TPR) repeat protein
MWSGEESKSKVTRALHLLLLVLILGLSSSARAQEVAPADESRVSESLRLFLDARLLDAAGRLGDAAEVYQEALALDPESTEIRVRFASLLLDMGERGRDPELVERALQLLEDIEQLDWYGRRVRAMALADSAGRRPELLEKAADALEEVVEERPDDPNLALTLAQICHRLNRLERAEELVAEILSTRGGSPQLVAYHASLQRALGRLHDAAESYGLCVDDEPMAEICRQSRVEILLELGDTAEAGEALLGWLEDDELDQMLRAAAMLYEGGRPEQALGVVERVLARVPDSPRASTLEALLLSDLGREEEAARAFRELLRKDRDNLDLMLPLAWSLARGGEIDEARKMVDRAWELVQSDAGSRQAAAVCLAAARVELEGGRAVLARDWLGRIADRDAASPEFIRLLAESYRASEQYAGGISAMVRLQGVLSEEFVWEAVAFEAEFRFRAGRGKGMKTLRRLLDSGELAQVGMAIQILQMLERWQDVLGETKLALEEFPSSVPLLFAQGAALERMNRIEESAEAFQTILESEPRNAAVANYLGYMWADNHMELERALQLIGMAVELEPENPAYLDSLGWVHYRLGNLEEARLWLQRSVDLGPADGTVMGHLGEVLLKIGLIDEARSYLQQSLTLGSENPEHLRRLLEEINARE